MTPPAFVEITDPDSNLKVSIRSERISMILTAANGGCRIITRDGYMQKAAESPTSILSLINPTPQPDPAPAAAAEK